MAKRGRKYQHAKRVRSENADSIVYGLPESPEQLSQRIDGRHRTRVINSQRRPSRADKARAIREQL
jgi:hypothetical protein